MEIKTKKGIAFKNKHLLKEKKEQVRLHKKTKINSTTIKTIKAISIIWKKIYPLLNLHKNINIMASIRNLKKDIDFLTNEVINDAFLAVGFHGKEVEQKVQKLLEDLVDFHNNLHDKINKAPKGKKNNDRKKYFSEIQQEIKEKYPLFFEQLSQIIANK